MRRSSIVLVCLVFGGASAAVAQGLERIEIKLAGLPAAVKAGSKFNARLIAKIDDGWHVYGLTKITGGPIPTRITVAEKTPFTLAGEIAGPVPIIDRDSVFGMDVEYYEGEAEFTLPLKVLSKAKLGKFPLSVSLRFQACNREMCLPPKVLEVTAPLAIAKASRK